MTDTNTNKSTELTPATLQDMPIGQKITAYEQILNDQASYTRKLEELAKKGHEVLEPAGLAFADYHQKENIKILKKRNLEKEKCRSNNIRFCTAYRSRYL